MIVLETGVKVFDRHTIKSCIDVEITRGSSAALFEELQESLHSRLQYEGDEKGCVFEKRVGRAGTHTEDSGDGGDLWGGGIKKMMPNRGKMMTFAIVDDDDDDEHL